MSASECPASNCSMRLWTLAAITSFAVLGCCWSMLRVVAALLMVSLSFGFCRCFSCHAWHVPTCRTPPGEGGAARRKGGVSPTRSKAEGERSEGLHKRSAEDCWETLAPRQGRALSEAWFPYACASAHMIYRVGVAGGKGPLRWEAENAQQSQRGRRRLPLTG